MKNILVNFLIVMFVTSQASAGLYPEEQRPDESFPSYFSRLTRGGAFPGIYLKAPASFAEKFHYYIRKNQWMGPLDKIRNEVIAKGYDLWFDVFRTTRPQKFFVMSADFKNALTSLCDKNFDYVNTEWNVWPLCARQAWIDEVLFSQGSGLQLAAMYKLELQDVKQRTKIFLLSTKDFENKVREAGWQGPIYFRGATMPDPKNPLQRWILLNNDSLIQYTSFDNSVLQMLEIAGIANHELSHVMQDFRSQAIGEDIQVRSAEQALVIEGQAEYLAEESFKKVGLFFNLFACEQAVEVVNREGQQAEQFPYTIGLPFVTTLYKNQADSEQVTGDLLKLLGQNTSLADYLNLHFN